MFSQVSDLRRRANAQVESWQIGTYVTDGVRLFCVTGIEGDYLCLEDASSECLERRSIQEAQASMREVKAQGERP